MLAKVLLRFCLVVLFLTNVSAAGDEKRMEFTVTAAPWTLTLPADNFVLAQKQLKPDGSMGYFHIVDEKALINLSMYIEPVKNCQTSRACRDMIWKMGNPAWINPQNVKQSELGDISVLEFLIPTFQDQPIKQQNMYAEFVVEGFWVDLHISKVLYKPEEHEIFERIIKSIKFEPKTKP